MKETKLAMGSLAVAVMISAIGCVGSSQDQLEIRTSALAGSGSGNSGGSACLPVAGASGTDRPGVRGLTHVSGAHLAAFRPIATADITQVSGTPLANPVGVAEDAIVNSTPWGYRRHDGVSSFLYVDIHQHVHELTSTGNRDLFVSSGANPPLAAAPSDGPVPDVIGYVRTDGRSAVVYRSTTDHVIELRSNFPASPPWLVTDVTAAAGTSFTVAKGSPFPFVRTDGWNSIPYIASDNRVHELATTGNGVWGDWDITGQTGDTVVPATDLWPYVRSDGWNTIVFVGADGVMREFGLFAGGSHWGSWFIPAAVSPRTGPYDRPSGYVRGDGVNVIVYVSTGLQIHELKLGAQGWVDSLLPTGCVLPIGQLFGHAAPSKVSSVLFQGQDSTGVKRYELSRANGTGGSSGWSMTSF